MLVILFAIVRSPSIYEQRGGVLSAFVTLLSLSHLCSGYVSKTCFQIYQPTGRFAFKGLCTTLLLSPTITLVIYGMLNWLGVVYGTTDVISVDTAIELFLLWTLVSAPLCVGAAVCRSDSKSSGKHFPCAVNDDIRPIPPDTPWYTRPRYLIPLAGLGIFGSVWIELEYVMSSLWGYKFYHVFGYLLCVFCLLTIVVDLVSIVAVYLCLHAENHRWQWTAFGAGASTGAYVLVYSMYYFFFRTHMSGLYQTAYFFGSMTWYAIHFAILCGTWRTAHHTSLSAPFSGTSKWSGTDQMCPVAHKIRN